MPLMYFYEKASKYIAQVVVCSRTGNLGDLVFGLSPFTIIWLIGFLLFLKGLRE